MAAPFVSGDLFEVKVKYAIVRLKTGLTGILILRNKEMEEKYKDKMQEISTQWKQPNFREHNELHSDSMVTDSVTGVQRPDYQLYKQLVMERCMKLWDITEEKDGKETPVELNQENIHKLDPAIAQALYDGWSTKTNTIEEDVGN